MAELSMALVQMEGLKCRIDDILSVTTYDEHVDLRGLHVDHRCCSANYLHPDSSH